MTHYSTDQIIGTTLAVTSAATAVAAFLITLHTTTHREPTEDNRTTAAVAAASTVIGFLLAAGVLIWTAPVIGGFFFALAALASWYGYHTDRTYQPAPVRPGRGYVQTGDGAPQQVQVYLMTDAGLRRAAVDLADRWGGPPNLKWPADFHEHRRNQRG